MTYCHRPTVSFAWIVFFVAIVGQPLLAEEPADAQFFEKQVLPILQAKCFKCHGGEAEIEGALRLTSREHVLAGGDNGAAVELDSPADSLLLSAINYQDLEMPPTGKLPKEQIAVLTRWVEMGLPYPDGLVKIEHGEHRGPPAVNGENRKFWSFQAVERPDVPKVQPAAWVANPIDAFILKKLKAREMLPTVPPADSAALVRRMHYDLLGLPPSPEFVQQWARRIDDDGRVAEDLIDELLASPHYGERWGRHWLDLVRYAETNSYERDDAKPEAWRYRDYVIRAFNQDKPYDQFIREQIAGDELDEVTPDSIIATGYYRLGRWDDEPVDAEQAWYDDMDDVLMTTSQAFLGLTMNCARCHDHKLDPIPQDDYYRFLAFFSNVERYGGPNRGRDVNRWSIQDLNSAEFKAAHEEKVAAHEKLLQQVHDGIAQIEKKVADKLLPVEKEDFQYDSNRETVLRTHVPKDLSRTDFIGYVKLRQRRDALMRDPPGTLGRALCVKESQPVQPRTMHLLLRGSPKAKDKELQPGFPQILGFDDPEIASPPKDAQSTHRRRALADWLASERNPLTARVMVNRIWQHHFGRGIVRSSNDFGFQGTPPTHPELLDWLAADFMAEGWRIKRLHKLIMLSNAYKRDSSDRFLEEDPENDLFWRFDMRRLSAEEVRDSILAASGELNLKMGGPSVFPVIPKEVLAGQSRPGSGWKVSAPPDRVRRSVYIHVKRSLAVPLLENHDMADVDQTCPVRFNTTVPSQALGMLNSQFISEQAAAMAKFIREKAGDDVKEQVAFALRQVTQREPTESEVQRGEELIASLHDEHKMSDELALKYFCLVALNLNEFVYLD